MRHIYIYIYIYFFFFFRILNIFNTHKGREEKILKKLTMMYIQNGLTLKYIVQTYSTNI